MRGGQQSLEYDASGRQDDLRLLALPHLIHYLTLWRGSLVEFIQNIKVAMAKTEVPHARHFTCRPGDQSSRPS